MRLAEYLGITDRGWRARTTREAGASFGLTRSELTGMVWVLEKWRQKTAMGLAILESENIIGSLFAADGKVYW